MCVCVCVCVCVFAQNAAGSCGYYFHSNARSCIKVEFSFLHRHSGGDCITFVAFLALSLPPACAISFSCFFFLFPFLFVATTALLIYVLRVRNI